MKEINSSQQKVAMGYKQPWSYGKKCHTVRTYKYISLILPDCEATGHPGNKQPKYLQGKRIYNGLSGLQDYRYVQRDKLLSGLYIFIQRNTNFSLTLGDRSEPGLPC